MVDKTGIDELTPSKELEAKLQEFLVKNFSITTCNCKMCETYRSERDDETRSLLTAALAEGYERGWSRIEQLETALKTIIEQKSCDCDGGYCEICIAKAALSPPSASAPPAVDSARMLLSIPCGNHPGWNRYDDDNHHVLHIWDENGNSYDIRACKGAASAPEVPGKEPR